MVAPSAGEASRRRRGELLDASPATARRVVFLLWGGASADPASLHDEVASWPSLVLQTSRVDGVEGFRRISRDRRRPSLSDFWWALLEPKRPKKRSGAAVSRVHRRESHHSSCQPLLQRARPRAATASKNKKELPKHTASGVQRPGHANAASSPQSEQQKKKWTPSAAPTPTAPKLCRASRRASI